MFRCTFARAGIRSAYCIAINTKTSRTVVANNGKQAEFLVHGTFPWSLVSRIGVYSLSVAQQVTSALANVPHKPAILEQKQWYY
jgi:hypothetical protein